MTVESIEKVRVAMVYRLYKHMKLSALVPLSVFTKMAALNIDTDRLEDAATLIYKFKLADHFDIVELAVNMV